MSATVHAPHHSPRLHSVLACLLVPLLATAAQGLILVGKGNEPVKDNNWPAGAVALANLKTRVGWWEGPPFGGGQHNFLYRGDTKAFQEALDLFAKIKAPELRVVVHPGKQESPFLRDEKDPKANARVDWSFTVWNPESYHRLYNDPKTRFASGQAEFREPLGGPQMDVYVGEGGGIDWKQVKLPGNVKLADERASSAGIDAGEGGAVVGSVYDLTTTKPLSDTHVAVEKHKDRDAWEQVATATSDADGKFELKGVSPGSYRVTASSPGYAPRALGYVGLQKDTLKRFTIRLAPAASITGTVTDSGGRPVAGVKVRADGVTSIDGRGYEPASRAETTTDAKGKFTLSGLPKGHAQLFARAKNFAQIDPLAVQTLPSEVTLRMTPTGDVRGKVLTPAGDPVAGPAGSVSISLTPEGGEAVGKWSGSMHVNPDGTYAFENVPPGKYVLSTNPHLARQGRDPNARLVEVKGGETAQVDVTHK